MPHQPTNRPAVIAVLSALAIYVVFHQVFEDIISDVFVKHIFSTVASVWHNDLIFLILNTALIAWFFKVKRRYVPSVPITLCLGMIVFVYSFYRFIDAPWNFRGFSFFLKIKYGDTIIIAGLLHAALLLMKPRGKENSSETQALLEDSPLRLGSEDKLGYNSYAENIAKKINETTVKKSFAIAINGKWGVGKTSFVQFIKNNLDSKKTIHITFNPWNSYNPAAIIKDFFDTVREAINPYHSSLSGLMIKYADKIVAINENSVTKSIRATFSLLENDDSLNRLYDNINEALKKINQKLIIYIDDLDRLDKEEIMEVIRLVRNTANFHNTFFIVSYDRNYLLKALSQHNAFNTDQFLEKIFQMELTLPHFREDTLRATLLEKLKASFSPEYHTELSEIIIGSSNIRAISLRGWIDTMRDITRLVNSVNVNITDLLGDVSLRDFIKIEILRLKYPSVYILLYKQKHDFFKIINNYSNISYQYRLATVEDTNETEKDEKLKNKLLLENHLTKYYENLGIAGADMEKVTSYVREMFPGGVSAYTQKTNLSIALVGKFDRYFKLSLFEDELSELKFITAKDLDLQKFSDKISEWVDKGLSDQVEARFKEINFFNGKEDFEKIIRAIFHFAHLKNPQAVYPALIGFDLNYVMNKLADYDGAKARNWYANAGGKEGEGKFVKSLLEAAPPPYTFESSLIGTMSQNYHRENEFPLSRRELFEYAFGYLKNYCKSINKIDLQVLNLFWNTQVITEIPQGNNSVRFGTKINEEALDFLIAFIKKDLDDFLAWSIQYQPSDFNKFIISKQVIEALGGQGNFKAVIFSEDEKKWSYLKEFKAFYEELEKDNFRNYLSFSFKDIPSDKILIAK